MLATMQNGSVRPPSQFDTEAAEAREQLLKLHGIIGELENRLDPVMCEGPPTAAQQTQSPSPSGPVRRNLVSDVMQLKQGILEASQRIASLTERLMV